MEKSDEQVLEFTDMFGKKDVNADKSNVSGVEEELPLFDMN